MEPRRGRPPDPLLRRRARHRHCRLGPSLATGVNLLGGTLAGSVLFYLVSNTAAWSGDLGYAHTLAGWWQAVTVGHPQYYPTIFFFRNSFVSDLAFTACFALAMEYASLREGGPSLLGLKKVRR